MRTGGTPSRPASPRQASGRNPGKISGPRPSPAWPPESGPARERRSAPRGQPPLQRSSESSCELHVNECQAASLDGTDPIAAPGTRPGRPGAPLVARSTFPAPSSRVLSYPPPGRPPRSGSPGGDGRPGLSG
ncbi:MAG: hypothetical protein MZV64_70660 [Ignavibacteriales bacterium]|nr:hypothetical protein [Ignavibacteriales bacterium]